MIQFAVRRIATVAVALVIPILIAACSSGAMPQALGGGPQEPVSGGDVEQSGGGDASRGDGDEAGPGPVALAIDIERRIVKIGDVTIEVEDVDAAITDVRALAVELGGYVGATEAGDRSSGATLELRIPADRFDDALGRLRDAGDVLNESTHEEDVTTQIVDLEARIANLRASEATYRSLLERATDIEDILAVQSRLDEVRGQIEQLDAQRASLAGQADLSTLTVHLAPQAVPVEETTEGWDPGATVQEAVAALLTLAQGVLTALIWIAVVVVPLGIVFGIGALIVLRLGGMVRRRSVQAP
jgi:hypothetical protein